MRALVYTAPNRVEMEERPRPAPGSGEVELAIDLRVFAAPMSQASSATVRAANRRSSSATNLWAACRTAAA